MKIKTATLLIISGLLLTRLGADDFAPEAGFTLLLNGRDLSGWHHRDGPDLAGKTDAADGRYTIVDGVLSANLEKGRVLMWTTGVFSGDFVLRFEFRAADKTDGGLFFDKVQLQCGDYHNYAYKTLTAYRANDWNAIEVVVQNGLARCTCNGALLESALAIPASCPIGFEADKRAIEYRHIRIKMVAAGSGQ